MILVYLLAFAVLTLIPLAWTMRSRRELVGRRESSLAIHRAQLTELDRDRAEGRIGSTEHATAKLEVQRRLLAAGDTAEPELRRSNIAPLAFAMVAVPLAAAFLYLIGGHPGMPAMPRSARLAEVDQQSRDAGAMIDMLRTRLAQIDPHSPQAREGFILLGNVEDSRGNLAAAAKAWRTAVDIEFEPTLAAQAAEAQTVVEGRVGPDAAALFRRALAAAPDNAPWRKLAESRLAEGARP